MAQHINRVTITGNLTRDPELKHLDSGTAICRLGVAVNGRRKDNTGQWVDDPNFFDVTVWGVQGENVAKYLGKGSGIAVDGRLDWRSWETDDGGKRSAVQIIAENVQFLSGGEPRQDQSDSFGGAEEATGHDTGGVEDDDSIPF